ncbi:dihydrolipoamide acetyltransferase family protein [Coralloluteibacterium stylophorae]|uniref:Dihydrolipoamide acetyltransferase component of pyruvate dehydrogenase complex n=3 Tax=Coralloluteibacterium stylophorae TaxID=1776034 RepID=A0AAP2G1K1_9GAMM|nr:dihydrolipoamide acetyltransferase family protein [Coralloluteibacterium stylophorae]MBS7458191.1 2-oxo acid dehydrogenase subunit E2 [Coralloluteibacterium stylophorae]
MSEKKAFHLPDLGEGLPDAEIVEWHVKVGDSVALDAPLVSMETAKAVVDVPSPFTGTVVALAGGPGDVIQTGAVLAEFELDASAPQRADAEATGHGHGPAPGKGTGTPSATTAPDADAADTSVVASDDGGVLAESDAEPAERADAGTVVGAMEASDRVHAERAGSVGGVRAMPAVRAQARKLKVDLARVTPSGADGTITLADVRRAAEDGSARLEPRGRGAPRTEAPRDRAAPAPAPARTAPASPDPAPAARAAEAGGAAPQKDVDAPIRGLRRNMVRTMSQAHAEVVPTTLMDDADIHAWAPGEDIMARLIRAIAVAAEAEPALNAWLNAGEGTLRRHSRVDVGIAVDTPEGLLVSALRNCERLQPGQVRAGITRIREQATARTIPPEEMRDYTIMLSNFGVFAGKYATPVVVPPCVAIIGAGRLFHEVVPVMGGLETHRIMPISLTFDHRAATGGEAARFLRALLDDLRRAR